MPDSLDIAEVVRRTGVSARTLRFYEARGLLAPLRTASGRRRYGPGQLAQLHRVLALKRAGLTLAEVKRLIADRTVNLERLIAAQLAGLDARAAAIDRSRRLLHDVQSRIERREPIDVATFCSLIEHGENVMAQQDQWDAVSSRYLSAEEKAEFADAMRSVPADFDHQAYADAWRDLGGRIKTALPLDPACAQAQAFLAEWRTLLAPFNAVATPAMKAGVQRMYGDMDAWRGQADPGFDGEVFAFITAAGRAASPSD